MGWCKKCNNYISGSPTEIAATLKMDWVGTHTRTNIRKFELNQEFCSRCAAKISTKLIKILSELL